MSSRQASFVRAAACCLGIILSSRAAAETFRYDIGKDQVVPYRLTITAETPSSIDTMKGVIAYTGNSVEGNTLTVEYKGGLTKSTKSKGRSSGPFRGGPRGRGGPPGRVGGPRSPFDQPDFRGLVPSTSTLVISDKGVIESMRGDSQLPYLLGNLSLMPFEILPPDGQTTWDDGSSLTITSGRSSSRFGPRFGPFARGNEEKTQTGGGESRSYRIEKDDGQLVTIHKTYSLSSPAPTSDDTGFEMKGTGTWIFNRELGASESMDFTVDLTVQQKNSRIEIPVTVKWKDSFEQLATDQQKAQVAAAMGGDDPFVVQSGNDGKETRQWTDKTGRFKIEAEFVKLDGTTVVLKTKEGKEVRVPKSRLSDADQNWVEDLAK